MPADSACLVCTDEPPENAGPTLQHEQVMSRTQAWDRYWAGGLLTTFGDKPTYKGELRNVWLDFFCSLPAESQIADLGAGNGAVAEIAREACQKGGRRIHLHAVDLARIIPKVKADPQNGFELSWHPRTPNEATGLDAASMDAVTGNFAIEYGDDAATVKEITRILKPGGRARFLMHHAQSVVIIDSRGELDALDALLMEGGVFDQARRFLKEYGGIRKPKQFEKLTQDPQANRQLARINEAFVRARARATTPNAERLIGIIGRGISQAISMPAIMKPRQQLIEGLDGARAEYLANRSRLRDMQAAAVDEARMSNYRKAFEAAGCKPTASEFRVPGFDRPAGWLLDVVKPA